MAISANPGFQKAEELHSFPAANFLCICAFISFYRCMTSDGTKTSREPLAGVPTNYKAWGNDGIRRVTATSTRLILTTPSFELSPIQAARTKGSKPIYPTGNVNIAIFVLPALSVCSERVTKVTRHYPPPNMSRKRFPSHHTKKVAMLIPQYH